MRASRCLTGGPLHSRAKAITPIRVGCAGILGRSRDESWARRGAPPISRAAAAVPSLANATRRAVCVSMAAMLRKFRGAGLLGTHGVLTRTDNWPYDKKTALCVSRLLAVVIS